MEFFSISIKESFNLYISTKPDGGERLENEIRCLKSIGNKIVLCSLLSKNEITKYQLKDEPLFCGIENIDFLHLEIPDESIPIYSDFKNLIETLIDKTKTLDTIVVHCKHGIGRSGMVAVAILLNYNLSLDYACKLVSKNRGYTVPQSKSQIRLLGYYYKNEIKT